MIILLNTSTRRKYITIRVQINSAFKGKFDCLKTDSFSTILDKAAEAVSDYEMELKNELFKFFDVGMINKFKVDKTKDVKPKKESKSMKIERMLTISNITENGLNNDTVNQYEIKMGDDKIGFFEHFRKDGLYTCLKNASKAVENSELSKELTDKLFYNKGKKNESSRVDKKHI